MNAVPEPVLLALQQGLPVCPEPFAEMAGGLGLTADALLAQVGELLADGTARRFGGVFDSRRMGISTALCAARIDLDGCREKVEELSTDPHITHCYERGPHDEVPDLQGEIDWDQVPNLWFTYGAEQGSFAVGLERARRILAPAEVSVLPAMRRFGVNVVFGGDAKPLPDLDPDVELPPLDGRELRLVRALQGHCAPCARFYDALAESVGMPLDELLGTLRRLMGSGRLKRVALVLRHRQAGYEANAMCGWQIADADVERIGRALAAAVGVTHCYERAPIPGYPFNLYAMMHAHTWPEFRTRYRTVVGELGLHGGVLMCSLREYKKTSPVYA
jgi:DNA-binding Lrp family transcriptional regulator